MRFHGRQERARRGDGLHVVAFTLEEQLEGFEHVRLVIGNEDARRGHELKVLGGGYRARPFP